MSVITADITTIGTHHWLPGLLSVKSYNYYHIFNYAILHPSISSTNLTTTTTSTKNTTTRTTSTSKKSSRMIAIFTHIVTITTTPYTTHLALSNLFVHGFSFVVVEETALDSPLVFVASTFDFV